MQCCETCDVGWSAASDLVYPLVPSIQEGERRALPLVTGRGRRSVLSLGTWGLLCY